MTRCVPMARPPGDPRPPWRFDSCPGAIRRGTDGRLYISDGYAWVPVRPTAPRR